MSKDLSILRPNSPKYKINQTVYSRISATKGFMEPLYIHEIELDSALGKWLYIFRRDLDIIPRTEYKYGSLAYNFPVPHPPVVQLIAAKLYEDQILTFCEAIIIQISVLQREYNDAVKKFDKACNGTAPEPQSPPQVYEDAKLQMTAPRPRYGINELIYLLDTAKTVGRLEGVRINDMKWDNTRRQWLYIIHYECRPEHNMTIGDKDNWRRPYDVCYNEGELVSFCEAQAEVVKFLNKALSLAQRRKVALCGSGSGSGT